MAGHAVGGGGDLTANEPLPERRIAGIECGMPVLIPTQQVGIFTKTFGEILFAEAFDYIGVSEIGLTDKLGGRIVILLLTPVNRDLSLGGLTYNLWFGAY